MIAATATMLPRKVISDLKASTPDRASRDAGRFEQLFITRLGPGLFSRFDRHFIAIRDGARTELYGARDD